ncbi:2Fe-2S iron-sulfur cluster-binding protein [Marinobacter orientalis]|uniref:2Fe-2S iron-sulfur cluster binding domain-containing protein n=1 Tax=Marinobacter orientalis TaxID=1928859 RepID=A0A7Y0NKC4_9GAMM|nr:2Fe-2S iron-sulfur cluster-binding protein [Marinobacter orientalis]NMT62301.1 2Fe-2S iron-sulfur cluster binding domain-containing protein [Marinobacter orientalis]TGX51008.1 2Fe-2S iron-sulfur cluster binding domain-containing protein [Marinobacter orientalis]
MVKVEYQGNSYSCGPEETVLEAMLRQGVKFPFSCRKGSCHACMHIAEKGALPPASQKGLSDEQISQGLFLPCLCRPTDSLSIAPKNSGKLNRRASSIARQQDAFLSPDPEMWEALDNGRVLSAILDDFYTKAFSDERLSPFFHGVTQQRAQEKQYLFLRQKFTGEKVYFGDRPKNAHHWMVISNDLFDYRESIMVECLERHNLPEHLIERWRALENSFRADIVKDEPWNRKIGDIEIPVSGYGEITLDIGSLCDSCSEEIDAGTTVRYHLRLGTLYCPDCMT